MNERENAMRGSRYWTSAFALCVALCVVTGCGGGGGGGSAPANESPPQTNQDLQLTHSTLQDQTAAVGTSPTFVFTFDAPMSSSVASANVRMRDADGDVPLIVSALDHGLSVRPSQPLKMRTEYTLTIDEGLRADTGPVLRVAITRRFKTVLFDGINRVVHPGSTALPQYFGRQQHVRIGDVNGDGRPDLVQIGGDPASYGGNNFAINVFVQGADGNFGRTQQVLVRAAQNSYMNSGGYLEIIDLDHDRVPEIVVSMQRNHPELSGLMVFKQDAQGRYAVRDFIATDFAFALFVADIDRDGTPDLLSLGEGMARSDGPDSCGMIAILTSTTGARPQPPTVLPCERYEAALGRVERPDRLHIMLLRRSYSLPLEPFQQRLRFYSLDQQGRPTLDNALMAAASPICAGLRDCYGLMLIDANGDGVQDLFFRTALVDDRLATSVLYARARSESFAELTRQSFDAQAYMVTDVDRDGLEDLFVVVQQAFSGSYVAAGLQTRSGTFELSHLVPVNVFDTMNQDVVAVGDLDGDGYSDVVLDSYNTGLSVLFQKRR